MPTSTVSKNPRSYHRHPSSLPTSVSYRLRCREVLRCPRAPNLLRSVKVSKRNACSVLCKETLSSWSSRRGDVPSTGKSSNSSSSSKAAAGFCWSLRVEESVESETVAFVVGPEPSAAADIVARKYSGLVRGMWTRMIGFQRLVQSSVSLPWTKKAP